MLRVRIGGAQPFLRRGIEGPLYIYPLKDGFVYNDNDVIQICANLIIMKVS